LTFKEALLIDSTTIRLFSDVLKGVGRNPKSDGKKKGGFKVHMLIDAVQNTDLLSNHCLMSGCNNK
jgi:hypothetical protein